MDDLTWRIDSLYEELDRLPMLAACWLDMDNLDRADVRIRWMVCVCGYTEWMQINWRQFVPNGHEPEWWIMIELRIEEVEPLIEFMELPAPKINCFQSRSKW